MNELIHEVFFKMAPAAFLLSKIVLNDEAKPVDFEVVEVNDNFSSFFNQPFDQVIGYRLSQMLQRTRGETTRLFNNFLNVYESRQTIEMDMTSFSIKKRLRIKVFPLHGLYLGCFFQDITTASHEERELFRTTLYSIEESIVITDLAGKITLMNPMAERLAGHAREDFFGKPHVEVFNFVNLLTREKAPDFISQVINTGERLELPKDIGLVREDGTEVFVSGNVSPIKAENGGITGFVVSLRDISKEYTQEKEIEGFLNVNLDMLCVADTDGNFLKVNKRFEEVLGYKTAELEGKGFLSFVHEDDLQSTVDAFSKLMEKKSVSGFTNRYRCKDGSFRHIEWNTQPSTGKFIYASARDVTDKRLKEEQLREIAIRDELTGLFNRYFFETVINREMDRSDRYDEPLSMLLLDLDYFKIVNDTWGHPAGDELLKQTARIIEKNIRESDILVRFGGEEFVVLMPQTAKEGALAVAEKIRHAKEQSNHPLTGVQTASIGVAERMKSESFKHWYRRTDAALYRAKEGGRNQAVFSNEQENLPVASVRIDWQTEWQSGNSEIDLQHQEMINIANRLLYMSFTGTGHEETLEQLDLLLGHIVHHFASEEKVLASVGYPALQAHAEIHKSLVAKALRLKKSFMNDEIKASAFFSFMLDDVIFGHLQGADAKFFVFTRKTPDQDKNATRLKEISR